MVILFSVPSHGRHQMGANSGVQWDNGIPSKALICVDLSLRRHISRHHKELMGVVRTALTTKQSGLN
jgi:hypothetical protein